MSDIVVCSQCLSLHVVDYWTDKRVFCMECGTSKFTQYAVLEERRERTDGPCLINYLNEHNHVVQEPRVVRNLKQTGDWANSMWRGVAIKWAGYVTFYGETRVVTGWVHNSIVRTPHEWNLGKIAEEVDVRPWNNYKVPDNTVKQLHFFGLL